MASLNRPKNSDLPINPRIPRGRLFAKVGATVVGATAAAILAKQTAAYATNHPQFCCSDDYPSCPEAGISCTPAGKTCCWYCADEQHCKSYRCCDKTVTDTTCTCGYFIGNFC